MNIQIDGVKESRWDTYDAVIPGTSTADGDVVRNIYVKDTGNGSGVVTLGMEVTDPWDDGASAHVILLLTTDKTADGTVTADTWGATEATGVTISGTNKPTHLYHFEIAQDNTHEAEDANVTSSVFNNSNVFLEAEIDLKAITGAVSSDTISMIVAGRPASSKPAWSDVSPWNDTWVSSWGDGTCTLSPAETDWIDVVTIN